jgi:hydroxypyruvate isomerase
MHHQPRLTPRRPERGLEALVELVRRAGTAIGEIQVGGTIGMEAYTAGDSVAALEAFRAAFTL